MIIAYFSYAIFQICDVFMYNRYANLRICTTTNGKRRLRNSL